MYVNTHNSRSVVIETWRIATEQRDTNQPRRLLNLVTMALTRTVFEIFDFGKILRL